MVLHMRRLSWYLREIKSLGTLQSGQFFEPPPVHRAHATDDGQQRLRQTFSQPNQPMERIKKAGQL